MITPQDLEFVAAATLGATLAVAGANKLRDPRGFVLGVLEYDILPRQLAVPFAHVVPRAELVLGVMLLTGISLPIAGVASALLLCAFLSAVSINLVRHRALDCHCFGAAAGERLGWMTVIRLLVLLGCAAIVLAVGERALTWGNALPDVLLAAGVLFALYLLGALPDAATALRTKGAPGPSRYGGRTSFRNLPLMPISLALRDRTHETSRCGSCS